MAKRPLYVPCQQAGFECDPARRVNTPRIAIGHDFRSQVEFAGTFGRLGQLEIRDSIVLIEREKGEVSGRMNGNGTRVSKPNVTRGRRAGNLQMEATWHRQESAPL